MNKVFNTGKGLGKKASERARLAKEVSNLVIPQLYLLWKDHKKIGDDGLPKSRPVCGASQTLNTEMSEWVSDILESTLATMESSEVISTEDLMSHVDMLNEKWAKDKFKVERGEIFIGSLDATALYPSLLTKKCAKLCGQLVSESDLEIL